MVPIVEFKAWPSISRLSREVVVTEKIDGHNSAIHIERLKYSPEGEMIIRAGDVIDAVKGDMTFLRLTAQSRTRLISVKDDNQGFAKWVADNASALAATLGEGIHYGEWWGYKIKRGYDLAKGDKRFSLFNTERWSHLDGTQVPGLYVVPVLSTGLLWEEEGGGWMSTLDDAVAELRHSGSQVSPGFMNPEGVVVFHTAGRVMFKYTLDGDANKSESLSDITKQAFAPLYLQRQEYPDISSWQMGGF